VEGARRTGVVAVVSAPLKARERDMERALKMKGKNKYLKIPGDVVYISIVDLLGLSSNSPCQRCVREL
jgi:muconolactone delta-isomerase